MPHVPEHSTSALRDRARRSAAGHREREHIAAERRGSETVQDGTGAPTEASAQQAETPSLEPEVNRLAGAHREARPSGRWSSLMVRAAVVVGTVAALLIVSVGVVTRDLLPDGPDSFQQPVGEVVLDEQADGPDLRPYASRTLNGENPLWHVEPGSSRVNRVDGHLEKVDDERFHRMFSTARFGGPGTSLLIRARVRATEIRDRDGSSIVEGVKLGLRFPSTASRYAEDNPRSAYGTGNTPRSPGSYQFLTGVTESGYVELSRNGYGEEEYHFFENRVLGYDAGEWREVAIVLDWLGDDIRVRYWHGTDLSEDPIYDVVDEGSPFADASGFLWVRADDADWQYDYITVEEFHNEGEDLEWS